MPIVCSDIKHLTPVSKVTFNFSDTFILIWHWERRPGTVVFSWSLSSIPNLYKYKYNFQMQTEYA